MTKHQEALERLNLQTGDRVRVVRKANDFEDGWGNDWVEQMNRAVGKIFAVKMPGKDSGVLLDFIGDSRTFRFPAHCLERVYTGVDCTIPE